MWRSNAPHKNYNTGFQGVIQPIASTCITGNVTVGSIVALGKMLLSDKRMAIAKSRVLNAKAARVANCAKKFRENSRLAFFAKLVLNGEAFTSQNDRPVKRRCLSHGPRRRVRRESGHERSLNQCPESVFPDRNAHSEFPMSPNVHFRVFNFPINAIGAGHG